MVLISQSCLSPNEDPVKVAPISGSVISPNIGGAAQPNQIWINLSDAKHSSNKRTDWDFAFYSGKEFRVLINNSIIMAVGKIEGNKNIDAIRSADVVTLKEQVQVGTFNPQNMTYIDNPDGEFLKQTSGLAEVSADDNKNPVYLVNMGRKNYTDPIANGTAITGGEPRGWKKVQLFRRGNNYLLRYANLDDSSHKEYTVIKSETHQFNFFSLEKETEMAIQPAKKSWDLGFTVFTNEVFTTSGQPSGSYVFADFVVTNTLEHVGAYQIIIPSGQNIDKTYNDFSLKDVDTNKFVFNDQRAIGDKWRITTGSNGAQIYANRFYIIKSAEGFFFKLRFTRMTNNSGERGFPTFEYDPL